jgi:ubiquinone/menaquinone biosynthesis C-methylase UbiE
MTNRRSFALDYDTLAADYARHRRVHPGVLAALVAGSGLTPDSTVLEVGCGTGNYLVALHDRLACRCHGIDPSDQMLATARARSDRIAFTAGRAESLPYPDATFDLVFSVDVIHHLADRPAFFRESRRVLAPGGRLATATDSEDDIARRRPLASHFPETIPVERARYPRLATLRAEMIAAGFVDLAEERVELAYDLTDLQPYRDRAFSSLHLIPAAALARGLARLETDLARGPIAALSLYTLLWGTVPS